MYENNYKDIVFLAGLDKSGGEYRTNKAWEVRKETYYTFLKQKGLDEDTRLLDIGCGAMPLAHALIPLFRNGEGAYFASDISEKTVDLGMLLLNDAGLSIDRENVCLTDHFRFPKAWAPIHMAFSNSVFSHLNLNSIYLCLYNLNKIMVEGGTYYSSFIMANRDHDPASGYEIGRFHSSIWADPFSYRPEVIEAIANITGFDLAIEEGYTAQHIAVLTKRESLAEDRITTRVNHKTPPQPWI
jgi:SAM-dependent methyltransferase